MKYSAHIAGYRQRLEETRRCRERDRRDVIERLRGLSAYFDRLPGLRRVYVFGSAAAPGRYTGKSDVDLAFEGLTPEYFCSVFSELVELLGRDVDALRLEDTSVPLRERILKGLVVYDRRTCSDP